MTTKDALFRIKTMLSNPTAPQISGYLVRYKIDHIKRKTEVIGKCALGELACKCGLVIPPRWEQRFIPLDGFFNRMLRRVKIEYVRYNSVEPTYNMIMKELGFPEWLVSGQNLPSINVGSVNGVKVIEISFDERHGSNIDNYIYRLNDAGFTYQEIVDFLITTFGDIHD